MIRVNLKKQIERSKEKLKQKDQERESELLKKKQVEEKNKMIRERNLKKLPFTNIPKVEH